MDVDAPPACAAPPDLTRRTVLRAAAAAAVAPFAGGCSGGDEDAYVTAVRTTWRHAEANAAAGPGLVRELIRYATLAPSSHNTQCWRFRTEGDVIVLLPDLARRCPAVDPDDHHLHASLGCAVENLILAARAHGLAATIEYADKPDDGLRVSLAPAAAQRTESFAAIPERQCTRGDYDGQALSRAQLRRLELAAAGDGVRARFVTARPEMESLLELVVAGNTAQMNDPAFMRELVAWIRFSDADALATRDGLAARASGNPTLPGWLARRILPLVFTTGAENDRYARQVRSSAGLAVFHSDRDDVRSRVEAGRAVQRFQLEATALGVRSAFLNQPVEVPALRGRVASLLGLGTARPDFVVRFGRGAPLPRSLRRPVADVTD